MNKKSEKILNMSRVEAAAEMVRITNNYRAILGELVPLKDEDWVSLIEQAKETARWFSEAAWQKRNMRRLSEFKQEVDALVGKLPPEVINQLHSMVTLPLDCMKLSIAETFLECMTSEIVWVIKDKRIREIREQNLNAEDEALESLNVELGINSKSAAAKTSVKIDALIPKR